MHFFCFLLVLHLLHKHTPLVMQYCIYNKTKGKSFALWVGHCLATDSLFTTILQLSRVAGEHMLFIHDHY